MILCPFIMPIAHGIVLHSCVCIFFGLYVCTHPCISWLACSCISYIHSHIGLVLLLFHPFVICDKNWDILRQLLSFILLRGSCILLEGGAYTRWRRCLDTCLFFVYIYLYGALDYLLVSMFSMSHLQLYLYLFEFTSYP